MASPNDVKTAVIAATSGNDLANHLVDRFVAGGGKFLHDPNLVGIGAKYYPTENAIKYSTAGLNSSLGGLAGAAEFAYATMHEIGHWAKKNADEAAWKKIDWLNPQPADLLRYYFETEANTVLFGLLSNLTFDYSHIQYQTPSFDAEYAQLRALFEAHQIPWSVVERRLHQVIVGDLMMNAVHQTAAMNQMLEVMPGQRGGVATYGAGGSITFQPPSSTPTNRHIEIRLDGNIIRSEWRIPPNLENKPTAEIQRQIGAPKKMAEVYVDGVLVSREEKKIPKESEEEFISYLLDSASYTAAYGSTWSGYFDPYDPYGPPSSDYFVEAHRTISFQEQDYVTQQSHTVYDVFNQYDEMIWQEDSYGVATSFNMSSGFYTNQGTWISWDESLLNRAAGEFANNLFSTYGSNEKKEKLAHEVEWASSGDWRLSFTALSGSSHSSMLERVQSMTQPHGMDSFLKWFYNRIEEWQRDVNIVSRVPIGGNDLTDIGNLVALVDVASQADSDSTNGNTFDPLAKGQLTMAGDEWNLSDLPTTVPNTEPSMLQTATAANALIESMAHWSPSASDSGAFADAASRKNQAYWSDLAPASLA